MNFWRKKAAFGNLLSTLVAIIFLMVAMFVAVSIIADMNLAITKLRIERKYMLTMETNGYLTLDNMAGMTSELTALGVDNISFEGTTLSKAGYGNPVYLVVTGSINLQNIRGIAGWTLIKGSEASAFKINQMSTAKY